MRIIFGGKIDEAMRTIKKVSLYIHQWKKMTEKTIF